MGKKVFEFKWDILLKLEIQKQKHYSRKIEQWITSNKQILIWFVNFYRNYMYFWY